MKPLPLDIELLLKTFVIDPTSPTGLRWANDHWKMKAGDVAGAIKNTGHAIVNFYGKRYHVHRIIWAMHNRQDPGRFTVDHIDRNPNNNHPDNLRLASPEGQLRNTKDRVSEYGRGVKKVGARYYARVHVNGKDVSLGGFATPEEAAKKAYEARTFYLTDYFAELYPANV